MKRITSINIKILIAIAWLPFAITSCKDEAVPLYGDQNQRPPVNYTWATTADSLQDKLYSTFLSSNAKYFVQNNEGNSTFHYWPNAHALDVLTDAYLRTDDAVYAQRMKALLNGIRETNGNTFINNFYDDMEWLALASLRAYEATNDNAFLDAANVLWTDIQTGINSNQGGGIAWRKSQLDYKNTPANAPAIIFAARLNAVNNNDGDLNTAISLYNWLKGKLVDPSTGLVWDGINGNGDGQISKNLYTYNQGTFVGAALELYQATNDDTYLTDAVRTAMATIKSPEITPGGILKSEGQGDGGLFKGILIRYFTLLAQEEAVPAIDRNELVKFLKYNAETLYTNGIQRPSLLISPDWTKKPSGSTDLTTQLSGMMLIEAAAKLHEDTLF
ncbi:glycosyl hydrolase family 76 [Mucilaginibacter limnophilus]|uniref:Glycosyl hydrolase family 76 n=1 Tax=Mucilaginibacter limnophilus TaxID=1932778 RepID=A0A437MZB9_9SPHI|nr:glycoside hydrolase family 76 protein [Mucilaginibacter limnophilus]RVU03030.1 glycosyl hydrolase family 76 [Mucilaginibacter limnophilus]